MIQEELFPIETIKQVESKTTCLTCEYRERWQCGGSIIQYCGVRTSNRTENGKLKIKCKNKSCNQYKKEIK